MHKPEKKGNKVPVMSAREAVALIDDNDTLAVCGAGGGILDPQVLIEALRERYLETNEPKDLTLWHSSGLGDRGDRGMSPLAQKGLVKRAIGGHWGQSPRLAEMAEKNEIEAYNFPQGVMAQLVRSAAAGHPGILSHVGLGTFVDPRHEGGKLNSKTKEDLIHLTSAGGKEWLFYPVVPLDVCFIRATTVDTEGYASLEDEITYMDSLAMAQAVHNNGGVVILQAKRLVKAGSIHPRKVKIPGYLVDAIVIHSEQEQLYNGSDRFFTGDYTAVEDENSLLKLDQRKVVARRALMEVAPGNVGNVGVGIADGIGAVAREEGIGDEFTLTVETGPVGGATAQGIFFGASINSRALMDMPAQFDFYDGGGLEVAFLSFAELDARGNVNVHKFNGKIMGTGGFVNICAGSKKVVLCGTLRAGGLKTQVGDGRISIISEGKFEKMIPECSEITFSGEQALKQGQEVIFITERAVFRLTEDGVMLTETAPGIDIQKDVIDQMGFEPIISDDVKQMDQRIFSDGIMGIRDEFINK
ncbi:acyl CoA:acetate/3-ketoacid CoA transferase [Anaerostipes sp.]|uniref:acyl CoA:acetate/3-ketoacid CoA transferase n=1 Tax=Anaerostipes sp. TaxID=1872530 RepID=UPI0025BEEC5F|nr:CoA-transferase [Anaerostipes sp.]MBS7009388.1 acetate CoA-transferase YdiF [Anaerostipes sp.]